MHSISQQGCSPWHYLRAMSANHVTAASMRQISNTCQTATLSALLERLDHGIQEEGLSLELSSKDTYEEVSRQLAAALSPPLEEPLKLRFTQQNNYTQQPKPQPMRFPTQEQDLPDMLHHFGQVSDTLFYEVLDLPLPELERLKTLKVTLPCKRCPCLLSLKGSCSKWSVLAGPM